MSIDSFNQPLDVVSEEVEVWKEIPGWDGYEASSLGRIRKDTPVGKMVVKQFINPNKGENKTYYCVPVVIDDYSQIKHVHQGVCMAFHPKPDCGGQIDVNHKDGIKTNNHKDNLEWLTHSENMLHALETGLRNDNIVVHAKSVLTGKELRYYSISDFSRKWCLSRSDCKRLISRHNKTPYKGEWVFWVNQEMFGVIKRQHLLKIKAFDHVEKKEILGSNATELQYLTGVNSYAILNRVDPRRGLQPSLENSLIAGWEFKQADDNSPWQDISIEKALASKNKLLSRRDKIYYSDISVKDYRDGKVYHFDNLVEAANEFSLIYGSLISAFPKGKYFFKGYYFKHGENKTNDWPVYTKQQIEDSINSVKSSAKALTVTDLLLNTTKRYSAIATFAKEIGKDPDRMPSVVGPRINDGKPYLDRYVFSKA